MELYLVRHGDALSKTEDPARPLSEQGRADVERVARAAAAAGLRPQVIAHSGKLRAKQTAEILAEMLSPADGLKESAALAPKADPAEARKVAEEEDGPWMLVGHLPHLERLASLLLTGDADGDLLVVAAASLLRLERAGERWRLSAMLPPALAAG